MEQTHDTVTRVFLRTRRGPNAEGADIDFHFAVYRIRHYLPGDNHPGVRTELTRFVLDMVPNQAAAAGYRFDIQKQL